MLSTNIGFIGGGQMACSLAEGFVRAKLIDAARIHVHDPVENATRKFASQVSGCCIESDNVSVVENCETVFLAVKPQNLDTVAAQLKSTVSDDKLVVSILAGVSLSRLQDRLGSDRVIRVMPNTPCLVGQGASAFASSEGASADDQQLVEQLLSAVGIAIGLDESLLDAVTGLSGSGPAYVFLMIEALSDGGVRMGLPRTVATELAVQTVLGAAQMLKSGSEHPAQLRDRVTSPGGTTIAGIQQLELFSVRAGLIAAVEAATTRSQELGQQNG